MSQSSNIVSRWSNMILRYSRDGLDLAKGIWNHTRNNSIQNGGLFRSIRSNNNGLVIKPILLDHARHKSNKVANSLLQIDKQIGLIKYYGLSEFIKQRLQQQQQKQQPSLMFSTTTGGNGNQVSSTSESSTTTAATTTGNKNNEPTTTTTTATIAFMVTASMKEELKTRLGYTPDEIKSMTPLHASLILNHNIEPSNKDVKLPELEMEYEKQREKERQESMERIALEEEKQKEKEESEPLSSTAVTDGSSNKSNATAGTAGGPGTDTTTSMMMDSSSSRSSKSRDLLIEEIDGFGEIWYEVIETSDETGETSRVGLYLDEDEAILGMEVRQDISNNKNSQKTYEYHQITKEQL